MLPEHWNLPPAFLSRLGDDVGRQRAMHHEGHLLLVLHAPPSADHMEREPRLVWLLPEGQWKSTRHGDGLGVLDAHVAEYAALLGELDKRFDAAARAADYFELLRKLTPLARSTRNLHTTLQEARRMCPRERCLINCRDKAYELERAADLMLADARHAIEFVTAQRAEEEAESSRQMAAASHRLNLLAGFFFPIATLTAIFGVSLPHGLERLAPPWPFLGVLGLGVLLGIVVMAFIRRRAR